MQTTCLNCHKPFTTWPSWNKKFCSNACYAHARKKQKIMHCHQCNQTFSIWIGFSKRKFCSRRCQAIAQKGKPGNRPKKQKSIHCLQCKQIFSICLSQPNKFCSKTCYALSQKGKPAYPNLANKRGTKPKKQKMAICFLCGRTFSTWIGARGKFCSRACWSHRNPPKKIICKLCHSIFETHIRNQKFCSLPCRDKFYTGITRRPKNRTAKSCDWCGKIFERPTSNFHSIHYFCCHSCSAKWWSKFGPHGKDHPQWMGGYTPEPYRTNWKKLRRMALQSANFTCEICGIYKPKRLEIDHIKPIRLCKSVEEANDPSNLQALCPKCHYKKDSTLRKYEKLQSQIKL